MTLLETTTRVTDRRWSPIDELEAANDGLATAHEIAVGLAVAAIEQAIDEEDVPAVRAITTTAMLVPELAGRIEDAIGRYLTAMWRLDVSVDGYCAAELDLSIGGPLTPAHEEPLCRFLEHMAWWPSMVSVMLGGVMAVDVANCLEPARRHAIVRAAISASG